MTKRDNALELCHQIRLAITPNRAPGFENSVASMVVKLEEYIKDVDHSGCELTSEAITTILSSTIDMWKFGKDVQEYNDSDSNYLTFAILNDILTRCICPRCKGVVTESNFNGVRDQDGRFFHKECAQIILASFGVPLNVRANL